MSAVNENIAREYFESLGFLVWMPHKYQVGARRKRLEEEVDLVLLNPHCKEQPLPAADVWSAVDFPPVARAVVGVRGWHTDRFSPGRLKVSEEVFRFAQDKAVEKYRDLLGAGEVARILCVPQLPQSASLREESLAVIRAHGVHGVVTFRTMLMELAAGLDVNKNYEKSDLLQILRLLKNYDLLKDPQLDFFSHKKRRSHEKEP